MRDFTRDHSALALNGNALGPPTSMAQAQAGRERVIDAVPNAAMAASSSGGADRQARG